MKKEKVERDLQIWFKYITDRYRGLEIKFGWSQSRGIFLVSFLTTNLDSLFYTKFSVEALNFADQMNEVYGKDAPLFTDNEELFSVPEM